LVDPGNSLMVQPGVMFYPWINAARAIEGLSNQTCALTCRKCLKEAGASKELPAFLRVCDRAYEPGLQPCAG
jgi:hypothetical protein